MTGLAKTGSQDFERLPARQPVAEEITYIHGENPGDSRGVREPVQGRIGQIHCRAGWLCVLLYPAAHEEEFGRVESGHLDGTMAYPLKESQALAWLEQVGGLGDAGPGCVQLRGCW